MNTDTKERQALNISGDEIYKRLEELFENRPPDEDGMEFPHWLIYHQNADDGNGPNILFEDAKLRKLIKRLSDDANVDRKQISQGLNERLKPINLEIDQWLMDIQRSDSTQ